MPSSPPSPHKTSSPTPIIRQYCIDLDWDSWCASDGGYIFQLMETFESLIRRSISEKVDSPERVEELLRSKVARLSAEGLTIDSVVFDSIRAFAKHWGVHQAIPTSLPVVGKNFLSITGREFKSEQLGTVRVARTANLSALSKGWFHIEEVILIRKPNSVSLKLRVQQSQRPAAQIASAKDIAPKGTNILRAFSRMLKERRAEADRIASKFTNSGWDNLSGRAVSGGLPGLGKRSR